jgi:anti-anti-sigma factor
VEFSSRQFADVAVAMPVGRIDHAAAQALERALAPLVERTAADGGGLVVDFAGVEYISSVGLRVLMVAAKQMRARHARIAVAALQPVVGEIFTISRFDAVLDVHASVRGALERTSPAALAAFDAAQGPGRT